MNLAIDKSKCCACTACKNICPKQAIEMISDFYILKLMRINV